MDATTRRIVDYYCVPQSPWTYLGHERFVALLARAGATVRMKPIDIGRVFAASGGLPLAQRPAARRSYRLLELARFRDALGRELHLEPRFFPVDGSAAVRRMVACIDVAGDEAASTLTGALLRAVWAEERDIADLATLDAIAAQCGLDVQAIAARASHDDVERRIAANTDEAIDAEVFGSPTYVPRFGPARDQRFWGQDRLDQLEHALTRD